MSDVQVLCVVWLGLVALGGVAATVVAPRIPTERLQRMSGRVEPVVDSSIEHLGRLLTAATVLFAGAGATIAVCWLLGRGADQLEGTIDWPVFRWFASRQEARWSDIWLVITNIGSPVVTQSLSLLGAVLFGGLFALRRWQWWVPPLTFAVAYNFEKFGQQILKLVVDRGHPPTTLGTWPSGGCARIILIYGLLVFFTIVLLPRVSRRTWFAGWSVVAFLDAVQAYSRMYNQEHWLTDVLGGMVYGTLLMLAVTSFYRILVREPRDLSASVPEDRSTATDSAAAVI